MPDRYHQTSPPEYAQPGEILCSGEKGVNISADLDVSTAVQASPCGICAKPMEGDEVLLLPTSDGKYMMLGVVGQDDSRVAAGELMLKTAGGAYIHLKQNGEILLNGLRITRDGTIM